ncbi:MAG: zinc ribbon domain-containing protein [Peptoanaerobacter stomatis]|uniref:zinc ribbon domain-containing protein n=1 Tax=Peptoanaerobacter stomatis TaxID=796937 RepID=UPI003FA07AFE
MGFLDKLNIDMSSMGFDDQETRQNKKMIEQTRQKQEQLTKSIDVDINNINSDVNTIFKDIGAIIYNKVSDTDIQVLELVDIIPYIQEIKSKKQDIAILEEKRLDIQKRYGEELEMLNKLLPQQNIQINAVNQTSDKCPNCNAVRMQGDMFCTNCGTKY